MSMKKKKSATAIPTAMIIERRIFRRKITKKIISGRIITKNKGTEGPTVMETDGKMQEI
jgi:hypothetical protein